PVEHGLLAGFGVPGGSAAGAGCGVSGCVELFGAVDGLAVDLYQRAAGSDVAAFSGPVDCSGGFVNRRNDFVYSLGAVWVCGEPPGLCAQVLLDGSPGLRDRLATSPGDLVDVNQNSHAGDMRYFGRVRVER